jgi:hypothetical protein
MRNTNRCYSYTFGRREKWEILTGVTVAPLEGEEKWEILTGVTVAPKQAENYEWTYMNKILNIQKKNTK